MIGFFEGLWQIIYRLISTIFDVFQTIDTIYDYFMTAIGFPITISGYVPPFILTSIYITIVIGVVRTILSWGNA